MTLYVLESDHWSLRLYLLYYKYVTRQWL